MQPKDTKHIPSPKISGGANDIYIKQEAPRTSGELTTFILRILLRLLVALTISTCQKIQRLLAVQMISICKLTNLRQRLVSILKTTHLYKLRK